MTSVGESHSEVEQSMIPPPSLLPPQGCWGEVQSDREQGMWARRNVFLLVQCGVWTSFLQLLHLEIDSPSNVGSAEGQRKLAVSASLADSADLRVILSVMYTIVETLRVPCDEDNEAQTQTRCVGVFAY
ncbi:Striatin-interacting protein 1 [Portunus trituberculatus]|uniref:Striatin-interacting protein 1 n=1 Tax=Portunus trituberculatus TaxID=210409 RepID=A0A5B7HGN9_PORTR|nr:Striatin-interacting protein 1 [Portunus trituberculatus]